MKIKKIRLFSFFHQRKEFFLAKIVMWKTSTGKILKRAQRLFSFFSKHKFLSSLSCLLLVYILSHLFYWYDYRRLPIHKKDIKIRNAIIATFPDNYDISITTADLVGLGEKFYIATGNNKFVKNAYFNHENMIKEMENKKDKVNRPIVKIFYEKDVDFFYLLLSLFKLGDMTTKMITMSLAEYYVFEPIPLPDSTTPHDDNLESFYHNEYKFPHAFLLTSVNVMDIDNDKKDEIIVEWLDYPGASRGTKWSTIIEYVDGEIRISSGYPGVFDIEFAKYMWAFLKYSGRTSNKTFNSTKLSTLIKNSAIDREDASKIMNKNTPIMEFNSILAKYYKSEDANVSFFIDRRTKKRFKAYHRSTDDFGRFIRVNDSRTVFVEAYYIDDDNCHWCAHEWRFQSFYYKDGRWISDRHINGDYFTGRWLSERQKYTLNEIFGTYPDQGVMGLAFSFLNPDWSVTSRYDESDPFGIEMRKISPVEIKLREIYRSQ